MPVKGYNARLDYKVRLGRIPEEPLIIMDSMKEVKHWLFHKFQGISVNSPNSKETVPAVQGALTPKTIPEFVIPGSGDSSRRTSDCSADDEASCNSKRNSFGGRSQVSTPPDSPQHMSPSSSTNNLSAKHLQGYKSAPVTPRQEHNNILAERDRKSYSVQGDINDYVNEDPMSLAAMSLPHLRTKTSFGFSTLSECPNTRRKESLFHAGCDGLLPKKQMLRLAKIDAMRLLDGNDTCLDIRAPSVVVTTPNSHSPSDNSSPESPKGAKSNWRNVSPAVMGLLGSPRNSSSSGRRFYNRRRSSLVATAESEEEGSSGNTSNSCSSNDLSQDTHRRSCGDLHPPLVQPLTVKRHSAPHIPSNQVEELPKQRSASCNAIPKNQTQFFAPYGELKFSFQYLAASKQLKVTLIRAENLGGQAKSELSVSSFAKLCLMPGKVQKQCGNVVKRNRNPFYGQEYHFHDLSLDQLHSMQLKIKLFHKEHNLKMAEFIGEVLIALDSYDLMTENRIWKDLDKRRDKEEIGFVDLGLRFEPKEGLLHVHVHQAKSLPQHPITGCPDPYVRVEVSQPTRSVSRKQTHTKKKTCAPVFDETFTFPISPKIDDLNYTTISFMVFDHEKLRTDDAIGQVVLGRLCTEDSQFEHWKEVLAHPGQLITRWHYLLDVDE